MPHPISIQSSTYSPESSSIYLVEASMEYFLQLRTVKCGPLKFSSCVLVIKWYGLFGGCKKDSKTEEEIVREAAKHILDSGSCTTNTGNIYEQYWKCCMKPAPNMTISTFFEEWSLERTSHAMSRLHTETDLRKQAASLETIRYRWWSEDSQMKCGRK